MNPNHDRIILDTHIWLWLMEGDPRIGAAAAELAESATSYGGLHVSALSIWEVAMLERANRVAFSVPLEAWLEEALSTPGFSVLALDSRVAAESVRLPGDFAGDPVDRLIVATARVNDAVVVTSDPVMLAYGQAGHLRVLAAR
ncbi:MAG: type II toxin-antitoxin system VapC family toxin [Spirochaetales bacterium]|nr:MAG: type II toxin-antitoxin system VapC family toxin [Spirochaetales bacterium]